MAERTYRQAVYADLDWLVHTENHCFSQDDAFTRRTMQRMIKNTNHSVVFDILVAAEKPIGYALFLTRRNSLLIRLYSICLLPAYRGQGLVESYLQERIPSFAKNYEKMGLEVRLNNTSALSLYLRLGFTTKKILPGYYHQGQGRADGYRMLKMLST
jgi:ribosomal protein S18 acetylase RimI-like enzyme